MATDYEFTAGTETWEATGAATTWVWTMEPRTGKYEKARVGGADGGSRFLRISIDDRRYNEQLIVEEMEGANPFRNGALKFLRVDGAPEDYISDVDTTYHLGPAELAAFFETKDIEVFRATVGGITSELVLRRLLEVGERHATLEQAEIVRDLVDSRYKKAKTQKAVREMFAEEQRLGVG